MGFFSNILSKLGIGGDKAAAAPTTTAQAPVEVAPAPVAPEAAPATPAEPVVNPIPVVDVVAQL